MSDLASLTLEQLRSKAASHKSWALFLDCKNAKTAEEWADMRWQYEQHRELKAEIGRREKELAA